jgi:alcohol dehydrogenase class IV
MSELGLKSELKVPDLIVFGTNTIDDLGYYGKKFGSRASLIYGGGSLRRSGNYERVVHILKNAQIDFTEISGISHDPDDTLVKSVTEEVITYDPDFIIGIGGGSVIDTAKAASIIATNGGEVKDYWEGKKFLKPSIPFIAVTTTSGTGSEVTKNAVITGKGQHFKKSIRSEFMIPNIALVDPSLTVGSPPEVTAATGLDALIQNLEAYTSKNAGPITDTLARKGIELSGKYLLKAFNEPDNLEAREGLSLSSLYGGITLLNAGLGLAHGLSHPLGIRFGIPHGKACAIVMAKVMEYNYSAREQKYAEVGNLLYGTTNGVEAFEKLMKELGISTCLRDYGIKKEDIPTIVSESKGGSRNFNPVPHSDETVSRMLTELM